MLSPDFTGQYYFPSTVVSGLSFLASNVSCPTVRKLCHRMLLLCPHLIPIRTNMSGAVLVFNWIIWIKFDQIQVKQTVLDTPQETLQGKCGKWVTVYCLLHVLRLLISLRANSSCSPFVLGGVRGWSFSFPGWIRVAACLHKISMWKECLQSVFSVNGVVSLALSLSGASGPTNVWKRGGLALCRLGV